MTTRRSSPVLTGARAGSFVASCVGAWASDSAAAGILLAPIGGALLGLAVAVVIPARDALPAVLEAVDLELKAGRMGALVGSSGAGKTTLAHLLPRFFDPQEGRITLNGRPLSEYTLKSLRRGMGLVDRLSRMVSSILKAEGGKAIPSWWIITG